MGDKMREFTVTATRGAEGRYRKASGAGECRDLGLTPRQMRRRFAGAQGER